MRLQAPVFRYAGLGNEVPHLHWHVVPRYPADGWWGQAFSQRPGDQKRPQPAEEYARLRVALRAALGVVA
jgi:diadenosine tetraphosphate (Ap4A) HIT family hydrolase